MGDEKRLRELRELGALMAKAKVRFEERTVRTDACWNWTGRTNSKGYGEIGIGKRRIKAHRFAYEMYVGPIPEGLTLDHLCRNRSCVNPKHLEPVTNRENVLRGAGLSAQNARKMRCQWGHPLEGDNLYLHPDGGRCCRTCKKAQRLARTASPALARVDSVIRALRLNADHVAANAEGSSGWRDGYAAAMAIAQDIVRRVALRAKGNIDESH